MSVPESPTVPMPSIAADLLDLLVCPLDRARLRDEGSVLVCTSCGQRYPVEAGIPNMLVDPA